MHFTIRFCLIGNSKKEISWIIHLENQHRFENVDKLLSLEYYIQLIKKSFLIKINQIQDLLRRDEICDGP
jgi:hypothetical protein